MADYPRQQASISCSLGQSPSINPQHASTDLSLGQLAVQLPDLLNVSLHMREVRAKDGLQTIRPLNLYVMEGGIIWHSNPTNCGGNMENRVSEGSPTP